MLFPQLAGLQSSPGRLELGTNGKERLASISLRAKHCRPGEKGKAVQAKQQFFK